MTSAHWVLLLEPPAGGPSLASRVTGLGMTVERATSVEAGLALLRIHRGRVAALLRADALPPEAGPAVAAMREAVSPGSVEVVATGRRPSQAACDALRAAGVTLALWDPFDDGTLRFQLKRALHLVSHDENRTEVRVPTPILARVRKPDRESTVIVYDLSVGGAYLETPRPSLRGARFVLGLPLPGHDLELEAEVRFANVPGNLKRPLLPVGMGVRFGAMRAEDREALGSYVASRSRNLLV